jgi:hypothetical protein
MKMLTKENYKYLKQLPFLTCRDILVIPKKWYNSNETMIQVARILDEEEIFYNPERSDTYAVITFFESPHKFERDIIELIKEYEVGENE